MYNITIIILAKKLSERFKKEIITKFSNGESLDKLSEEFNFAKSTISRHLKINLGVEKFKEVINKFKSRKTSLLDRELDVSSELDNFSNKDIINKNLLEKSNSNSKFEEAQIFTQSQFTEIVPLEHAFQNSERREISSVPISDIDFPGIVYMIVDKNIELKIKLLKEYPEWNFLPAADLDRKTIEIFFNLKIAKRFCTNEQKVIKVPNTDVFRIVAPLLASRGISRIVSSDNLISL